MTSMTDVLLTARTFLERFARVDVTCPANNKRAYLNGAYDDRASKLDLALCALTCSAGMDECTEDRADALLMSGGDALRPDEG